MNEKIREEGGLAMNRIIVCFLIGIVGVLTMGSVTLAADEEVSEDEIAEIIQYIESDEVNKEFIGLQSFQVANICLDQIKRVNSINNCMVSQYQSNGSISASYSDVWQYLVPIEDGLNRCVITLIRNDEGFECVGAAYGDASNSAFVKYTVTLDDISSILQNAGVSPQSIIHEDFLICYMYRSVFYYFVTEDGEFLIPYSDLRDEEDQPILVNGRIYSAEEIINELDSLGIEQINEGEPVYGGITKRTAAQKEESTNHVVLKSNYVLLSLILIGLLVFLFYVIVLQKKHPL